MVIPMQTVDRLSTLHQSLSVGKQLNMAEPTTVLQKHKVSKEDIPDDLHDLQVQLACGSAATPE